MKEFEEYIYILAERSAEVILPYFANSDMEVMLKDNQTPVTRADREAEEILRAMIRKRYPSHGIIGEEFGHENEAAEFVWILDPIDGTITFTSGCPLFGTLICLLHQGRPMLGTIHLPALGQLCVGNNRETVVNRKAVRMREITSLSEARLLTTDIENIARYKNKTAFDILIHRSALFRTWGDCYGYFLLASGWADIMLDPIMNPWDLLPLIPVIQGAGGVITTWNGDDAVSGDSCIAANKILHPQVLQILNSAPSGD